MHEIRSTLIRGESRQTLARKQGRPRSGGGGLSAVRISRQEARRCDQRREGRHLNLVEQAALKWQRRTHEVAVLNVSSQGAMIESDIEPRIGARVDIAFPGCEPTRCSVRWLREGRIGLEFEQTTLVIAPREVRELIVSGRRAGEQPTVSVGKTRAPRHTLILRGELHWPQGTMPVRLRNVSANGAMCEGERDLDAGTQVVLDLGGIAATGCVKWCRSQQIGIAFDQPLDLAQLAQPEATAQSPEMLKPDYLKSETDPNSPWAARWERLMAEDL